MDSPTWRKSSCFKCIHVNVSSIKLFAIKHSCFSMDTWRSLFYISYKISFKLVKLLYSLSTYKYKYNTCWEWLLFSALGQRPTILIHPVVNNFFAPCCFSWTTCSHLKGFLGSFEGFFFWQELQHRTKWRGIARLEASGPFLTINITFFFHHISPRRLEDNQHHTTAANKSSHRCLRPWETDKEDNEKNKICWIHPVIHLDLFLFIN